MGLLEGPIPLTLSVFNTALSELLNNQSTKYTEFQMQSDLNFTTPGRKFSRQFFTLRIEKASHENIK